jgi:hypothetical protein
VRSSGGNRRDCAISCLVSLDSLSAVISVGRKAGRVHCSRKSLDAQALRFPQADIARQGAVDGSGYTSKTRQIDDSHPFGTWTSPQNCKDVGQFFFSFPSSLLPALARRASIASLAPGDRRPIAASLLRQNSAMADANSEQSTRLPRPGACRWSQSLQYADGCRSLD